MNEMRRAAPRAGLGLALAGLLVAGAPVSNSLVVVPHLNALQGTPIAAAPNGMVRRLTDGVAGAPPLDFQAGAGTCAATGLTNDGASCVNSSDGNHWLGVFPTNGADVRQWGADPTGANDSEPAFAAAAKAAFANKVTLIVPKGMFKLNAQLPVTFPTGLNSFSIRGQGIGSVLTWPNAAGGIAINANLASGATIAVRDLMLTTAQAGGGTGIAVSTTANSTADPSEFTGITCQGADGGLQTDYWTACLSLTSIKNVAIRHITVLGNNQTGGGGTGIVLAGASGNIQVIQNLDDILTDGVQYGVTAGDYTQGLIITKLNCVGGTNCFKDLSTIAGASNVQIWITDSQLNANNDDISLTGAAQNINITNNLLYCPASYNGIRINPVAGSGPYTIADNQFLPLSGGSEGTGIIVNANTVGGNYIGGNTFLNLPYGISLAAPATGWRIGYNSFLNVTAHVSDLAHVQWPDQSSLGGNAGANLAAGSAYYIGVGTGSNTTETNVEYLFPFNARTYGMTGYASAAQGAGQSATCKFKINGALATQVITFNNAVSASDNTHYDQVNSGNVIDVSCTSTASATPATYAWSVNVNPLQ
jgi:hypothetical protein